MVSIFLRDHSRYLSKDLFHFSHNSKSFRVMHPPVQGPIDWWTQTHGQMLPYAEPFALSSAAWPPEHCILTCTRTRTGSWINVVTPTGCRMYTEAEFRAACNARPCSQAEALLHKLNTLDAWPWLIIIDAH